MKIIKLTDMDGKDGPFGHWTSTGKSIIHVNADLIAAYWAFENHTVIKLMGADHVRVAETCDHITAQLRPTI